MFGSAVGAQSDVTQATAGSSAHVDPSMELEIRHLQFPMPRCCPRSESRSSERLLSKHEAFSDHDECVRLDREALNGLKLTNASPTVLYNPARMSLDRRSWFGTKRHDALVGTALRLGQRHQVVHLRMGIVPVHSGRIGGFVYAISAPKSRRTSELRAGYQRLLILSLHLQVTDPA